MNHDKDRNFEQNMNQLISLLKKMLKNLPSQDQMSQASSFLKESGINLNLCFFTFLPVDAEELEEFEEIYDQFLYQDERHEEFSRELSSEDLDFLRRHGISF